MANSINTTASGVGTSGGTVSALDSAILTVYSQEILFEAQPLLRFEQVATRKEELGVLPGKTIQFLRYSSLTGSAALTENTDMETDAISASTISITVAEYGKAIAVTEFLIKTAYTDVLRDAARLLGMHYAKVRDGLLRDVLLGSGNVKYAGGKARTTLTATDVMDTDLIKDMVEQLATNKAPKINGDAYICFLHPHQARSLRDDPAWVNASNYGAPGQLFTGEVGRFEDVRFIETTQMPYILSTANAGSTGAGNPAGAEFADGSWTGDVLTPNATVNVYRCVMVGDHAMGLADALPVEMRDDGVKDHGRRHSLAWYGIWGQSIIESGHIVTGETA